MTRAIPWLAGLLAALSVQARSEAIAQAGTPESRTQPRNVVADVPVTGYPSALGGYRAFQDEKIASWKASNDTVARIGGWRAYAREAGELEPAPRDLGRDTPAAPAGHPPTGHGK